MSADERRLAGELFQALRQQGRIRLVGGRVEVLGDDGQWRELTQPPSEVTQENVVLSRRKRDRGAETSVFTFVFAAHRRIAVPNVIDPFQTTFLDLYIKHGDSPVKLIKTLNYDYIAGQGLGVVGEGARGQLVHHAVISPSRSIIQLVTSHVITSGNRRTYYTLSYVIVTERSQIIFEHESRHVDAGPIGDLNYLGRERILVEGDNINGAELSFDFAAVPAIYQPYLIQVSNFAGGGSASTEVSGNVPRVNIAGTLVRMPYSIPPYLANDFEPVDGFEPEVQPFTDPQSPSNITLFRFPDPYIQVNPYRQKNYIALSRDYTRRLIGANTTYVRASEMLTLFFSAKQYELHEIAEIDRENFRRKFLPVPDAARTSPDDFVKTVLKQSVGGRLGDFENIGAGGTVFNNIQGDPQQGQYISPEAYLAKCRSLGIAANSLLILFETDVTSLQAYVDLALVSVRGVPN